MGLITYYDIEKEFNAQIDHLFPKSERRELNAFLKNHERKRVVVDNLIYQIKLAEKSIRMDRKTVDHMVKGVCNIWVNAALEQHQRSNMSTAARRAIKSKDDIIKEAEGVLKEVDDWANDDTTKVFT